ncbi:MAG: TonB C-terminal domain-containing protein [Methylococcales bacterium]|nr:TonB C-terminal domain-containing protein [Methylococcales bacterium]
MIWALGIAVVLHVLIWLNFTLKPKPPEHPPAKVIEVSLITKTAPIKAKQNDQIVAEPQPASLPQSPKPELIKPVDKPVEKSISKPIEKTIEQKKEPSKPKIVTVQKSEVVVKKVPPAKIAKVEPLKKVEEPPKEKPRLSLESLQQQISQVGTEVRQQQVSERDKYISAFSSKVKRVGQEIYDRGTLPAGSLTTLVEINVDGTIKSLKITHSSGNAKLDAAVENMVYSAAPYSALPFQLQNEANTLTFSRNWEFFGD